MDRAGVVLHLLAKATPAPRATLPRDRPLPVAVGIAEWSTSGAPHRNPDIGLPLPPSRDACRPRVRAAVRGALQALLAAELGSLSIADASREGWWTPELDAHTRALCDARALECVRWLAADQSDRTRFQVSQAMDLVADWLAVLDRLRAGRAGPSLMGLRGTVVTPMQAPRTRLPPSRVVRAPDCQGCVAFPYALCPACNAFNLRREG
jgi:hypothetical protein